LTADDRTTVAVVTGAARGIGRGIALVLGEAGATVYVTDRESRARRFSELPGTVEETAEQVTERGGRGIAVAVDHADDDDVDSLFERVRAEHGGLDLLVGNAFNGNALPFRPEPFWTLAREHWHNMLEVGVRSHLIAAQCAAPLLMARERGLIVLTGYTAPAAEVLGDHVIYDLAMHATSRLAQSLAHELRPRGVTALALSPGLTRTEAIVAALGPMPAGSDSVEFPGRAVRALLEDPAVERHAGRTLTVAELAIEYGFGDIDQIGTEAAG
jgi:dehydrogenase/reductase SDR family protein 1